MAEERADERQKIAAYLHDDLAQVLFRLSIQVDVARKLLDKGDIVETGEQLEKIRESKQDTSDRIRALDPRPASLAARCEGLWPRRSSRFTDEVGRDSGVHFHLDVHDVELPAPIALLIYKIAWRGLNERAEARTERPTSGSRFAKTKSSLSCSCATTASGSTRRCRGRRGTSG
jgi:signal transduction histidine kinase